MTDKQVQLIQRSWQLINPVTKDAVLIFYEKLFMIAPGVRHLFKDDMDRQAEKLTAMLQYIVSNLGRLEDITAGIQQLGERHNDYGVKPEHYDIVGNCLISVLKHGLAERWNDELQEAWVNAFTILKTVMTRAQEEKISSNT